MKIVARNKTFRFDGLFSGDVFIDTDGAYCLKVDPIDEWVGPDESEEKNAINLSDGSWRYVSNDAQVQYVECELSIK